MIEIICEQNCVFYKKAAKCAFKQLGLSGNCTVELVIASGQEIARLNNQFRGIDKETDVLSFPAIDFSEGIGRLDKINYPLSFDAKLKAVSLGSIVINEGMAAAQAHEYGHSEEREKAYLFLHGLLHLLGYDHIDENDKRTMRNLEEKILKSLGLNIRCES